MERVKSHDIVVRYAGLTMIRSLDSRWNVVFLGQRTSFYVDPVYSAGKSGT